ncbi:MAG: hypothetical protein JRF63_04860 [Deltaproteobacteria bacterium]|nr:hypothetical protein [Deltaproteobacteria bacterium]
MKTLFYFITFSVVVLALPAISAAQDDAREKDDSTIKDDVKQHVKDSLDKAKQDAKDKKDKKDNKKSDKKKDDKKQSDKKKNDKKKNDKKKDGSDETVTYEPEHDEHEGGSIVVEGGDEDDELVVWADPVAAAEGQHPKLPRRIFHRYFKLDLIAGAGYRGWVPQQYPTVSVDMANYFTWSVGAKARLFNTVNLHRAYYETNNAASPRSSYLDDATRIGNYAVKAAWFLAELGVPILDAWEPTIRYEARSFQTTAKIHDDAQVCVIPFGQDTDVSGCTPTTGPLSVTSSFESAALGIRYHPDKGASAVIHKPKGKAPRFFLGGAYLSYLKPYQVTIGDAVLEEYLFTGRFYGGGLAVGIDIGGGVNNFKLDLWTQLGLGKVRLTDDLTLNELAPQDWMIGYVQGNGALSFRWAPFDFAPTLLIVPEGIVSGASFFFFETQVDEGEEVATPSINWDVLYTVRLSLIITL